MLLRSVLSRSRVVSAEMRSDSLLGSDCAMWWSAELKTAGGGDSVVPVGAVDRLACEVESPGASVVGLGVLSLIRCVLCCCGT